jgi:endonuclease YncB( thermonuclease family)
MNRRSLDFFGLLLLALILLYCPVGLASQNSAGLKASIGGTAQATIISGKVVGVHDGDTITVLDGSKTQYKVRLAGIDAPELGQPFGQKAKKNLSSLVYGKDVIVSTNKIDRYGRRVATVFVAGIDVNLEQVKSGLAWHFKRYEAEQDQKDRSAYSAAERAARTGEIGFWQDPTTLTPPWDYRDSKRDPIPGANTKQSMPVSFLSTDSGSPQARKPRIYLPGPRGGCYYVSPSGNKTYVDRNLCTK